MSKPWTTGQGDGPADNIWQHLPDVFLSELLASTAADDVTLALQHGMNDLDAAKTSILAIEARGALPFVRLPREDPTIIGYLLDAGAVGLICPTVESAQQATDFVAACHYPPHGRRSYGPLRATLSLGADYFRSSREQILTFAMIETVAGLNAVEEIASVPLLTGLFIGPGDLGVTMGLPPSQDRQEPEIIEAIEKVLTVARGCGKRTGIHAGSTRYAVAMAEQGFDLVTIMSDAPVLSNAAREAVKEFGQRGTSTESG